MYSELVKNWFGSDFSKLHPLLQTLHTEGGTLTGQVDVSYGDGLAGLIGKRLAKKMNFPSLGTHQLAVDISHDDNGLHWSRCFNNQERVASLFRPVGSIKQGYWVETTGPLTMMLTVDIIEGGWHWRCLSIKFLGLPVPLCLIPKTTAYKTVVNDKYRFFVQFSMPVLGRLVSYQGQLQTE